MQLGMIGLGRMGANMVRRLEKAGHKCVVYDRSADSVKQLAAEGATGSSSIDDFISKLQKPRAIWLMVPAAVVDSSIAEPPKFLAEVPRCWNPRQPREPSTRWHKAWPLADDKNERTIVARHEL